MTWNHLGVEIELSGASFVATCDGKRIASSSLAGIKKAIDKQKALKAQEVPLRMKLVAFDGRGEKKFVLIGLDTETLRAVWEGERPSFFGAALYCDDDESRRVVREFQKAEKAYKAARDARDGREISLYFNKSKRPYTTYAEAIEMLKKRYADAKAGKAE